VALFSDAADEGLDAVVLLKRSGTVLGAWSRGSVDLDVVCVMTATLLGSVETIVQAMHCQVPQTLRIESENCQLLATRLESQATLVLIAPTGLREADLRRTARAYAARLVETASPEAASPSAAVSVARRAPRPERR